MSGEQPIDDAKETGGDTTAEQVAAQEALEKAARERGGLCAKCNSIVPLGETYDHGGQLFHKKPWPPPKSKGFRPQKGTAICGPVLTMWRYRIAYVIAGEHHAECLDLPWPLRNPHNFEMLEHHLAEVRKAERVTVLWYHLLHTA